jgi:hypothetical protein
MRFGRPFLALGIRWDPLASCACRAEGIISFPVTPTTSRIGATTGPFSSEVQEGPHGPSGNASPASGPPSHIALRLLHHLESRSPAAATGPGGWLGCDEPVHAETRGRPASLGVSFQARELNLRNIPKQLHARTLTTRVTTKCEKGGRKSIRRSVLQRFAPFACFVVDMNSFWNAL